MKLSVSLPDEDVEFLDRYAAEHGIGSRSAAVQTRRTTPAGDGAWGRVRGGVVRVGGR